MYDSGIAPSVARFSIAFLLAQTMVRPGATPNAFCVQESTTSIPMLSMYCSAPPEAATPSTM